MKNPEQQLRQLSTILSGLSEEKERMASAFSEILLQVTAPRINEKESQAITTDAHLLLFHLKGIIDCAGAGTLNALDARICELTAA